MFKLVIYRVSINIHKFITRACSTNVGTEKWDLCTAVCLERRPLLIPEMNDMQKQFNKQLSDLEYEKSKKSAHEIRHEKDLEQIELLKKGDADVDASLKQMAQDFLDASVEELNQFKVGNRITDADKSNNLKSLNRKLDKNLVLLTQQKLGEKSLFLLPQGMREDGESLRQTADRVLKQTVGDDLKAEIYGNAPVGFYMYRYPTKVRNDTKAIGAKIFFYFARYMKGDMPENKDFKWLDRQELDEELPDKYNRSVKQFLIDE